LVGYTALIFACKNSLLDVALSLINTFGDKCIPPQVSAIGQKALSCAIRNNMDQVAELLKKYE
jgi:ankyrin repeat protein